MIRIFMALRRSRWRTIAIVLFAFGAWCWFNKSAQSSPDKEPSEYDSPTIRRLSVALRERGTVALNTFWRHVSV
ncbi:MAG TPA: hypothetical protein VHZ55_09645, partial [Bryobacteraceae bacterium]|nr:hypothetical protein [Bryobacteraceae bacterium]